MGRQYRKRRQNEMREKNFHVILYHNNHSLKEITLPSFIRKVPSLAVIFGMIVLLVFVIQFGVANYSTYHSLNVAYEYEILQVKTARILHEKVIELRGDIQFMYTK